MTVIAGIAERGRVYLACDSILVGDQGEVSTCAQAKIWRRGEYLLGAAGACRADGFMRYAFEPPTVGRDVDRTVVHEFVREFRRQAKATEEDLDDTTLIVAVRGRLYVGDCGYLYRERGGYSAIGAGEAWARASLATSKGAPRDRLKAAMRACAKHCAYVRGPFRYYET